MITISASSPPGCTMVPCMLKHHNKACNFKNCSALKYADCLSRSPGKHHSSYPPQTLWTPLSHGKFVNRQVQIYLLDTVVAQSLNSRLDNMALFLSAHLLIHAPNKPTVSASRCVVPSFTLRMESLPHPLTQHAWAFRWFVRILVQCMLQTLYSSLWLLLILAIFRLAFAMGLQHSMQM